MKLLLLVSSLLASSTTSAFSPQPTSTIGVGTALHYTVAANLPPQQRLSIEDQMRQAEEKMRQRVAPNTPPATTSSTTTSSLPNMMEIDNWSDFERYVLEEPERITLVRFHAPFCRACKAMAPQLDRFARLHPHVNFVQIAWNKQNVATTQLIRRLGVTKVPHGQVYVPTVGLVEEANLGKQYFNDVGKIVDSYQTGICDLPDEVNEYSQTYASPYLSLNAKGKRIPVPV